MPLHKVSSAHKRAVLRCAAVVVPEIKVSEVDGVREWRSRKRAIFVEIVHDRFGCKNLGISAFDNLLALAVNPVNQCLCMALRADLWACR